MIRELELWNKNFKSVNLFPCNDDWNAILGVFWPIWLSVLFLYLSISTYLYDVSLTGAIEWDFYVSRFFASLQWLKCPLEVFMLIDCRNWCYGADLYGGRHFPFWHCWNTFFRNLRPNMKCILCVSPFLIRTSDFEWFLRSSETESRTSLTVIINLHFGSRYVTCSLKGQYSWHLIVAGYLLMIEENTCSFIKTVYLFSIYFAILSVTECCVNTCSDCCDTAAMTVLIILRWLSWRLIES